jgi:hypothetical protein
MYPGTWSNWESSVFHNSSLIEKWLWIGSYEWRGFTVGNAFIPYNYGDKSLRGWVKAIIITDEILLIPEHAASMRRWLMTRYGITP